jgi:hypothetical protein
MVAGTRNRFRLRTGAPAINYVASRGGAGRFRHRQSFSPFSMPAQNAAPTNDKVALDSPTFCGTISEARYTARERREARSRKPQPWAVRKLMVVVTLAIMGYTAYVYGGRFFVRLMNSGRRREGSKLVVRGG